MSIALYFLRRLFCRLIKMIVLVVERPVDDWFNDLMIWLITHAGRGEHLLTLVDCLHGLVAWHCLEGYRVLYCAFLDVWILVLGHFIDHASQVLFSFILLFLRHHATSNSRILHFISLAFLLIVFRFCWHIVYEATILDDRCVVWTTCGRCLQRLHTHEHTLSAVYFSIWPQLLTLLQLFDSF